MAILYPASLANLVVEVGTRHCHQTLLYLESNYIKITKCDYYIEDTFAKTISKIQEQKRALSMFHMNIKSLPKHFDELQQYLHMFEYDFSVIGISETRLNENNADLYGLKDIQQ